jgi:hAT family C-terminal dimerisation region
LLIQYNAYLLYHREKIAVDATYFETCDNHVFWTNKTDVWPHLADVALNLAQIPASSIAAERVFAQARTIDSPQRQSLGWDSFCNEVNLHVNKQMLQKLLEINIAKLQRLI